MAAYKLKWSSLLHLTELDFIPEAPKVLSVSDELLQSISWLTGATKHDRKLIRCNELGAVLVGNAWDNLTSVETDELIPASDSPDTYTATKANRGVLIATSTQMVMADFYQVGDSVYERFYLPPYCLYFYPYKIVKVIVATVPFTGGTTSYVGVTALN